MTDEAMVVGAVMNAPAETVFDLLADPLTHVAIDGTGWVRQPVDGKRLTETGQIFRMRMYHDKHPNQHNEMANRVEVFDRPRAIAWQPERNPDTSPVAMVPTTALSSTAGGSGATTSSRSVSTKPRSR